MYQKQISAEIYYKINNSDLIINKLEILPKNIKLQIKKYIILS